MRFYLPFCSYLTAAPLAPQTSDINIMIVVAVILLAAFSIFILIKGRRRG